MFHNFLKALDQIQRSAASTRVEVAHLRMRVRPMRPYILQLQGVELKHRTELPSPVFIAER